ncbi:MAG: 2-amino-4-hydroxy-6-hydroxymethyldihydropteridine diphosphokinase [Rhodospirillales bacterium]|nr:2-amino-4-hydroxy-6-hydroxymethyldihydropteridine diphosphokinase [Rhodospirillales bacterium]
MTASKSTTDGVFIALGANLPSATGSPRQTLEAVLHRLDGDDITVVGMSRWYETEPVPPSDQPWFVNGVAELRTTLGPDALLAHLHDLEHAFGRVRRERWEARAVDLDLLDHAGEMRAEGPVLLPHPRMTRRAFVLLPLRDIAPDWRDPGSGRLIDDLIAALPDDGGIVRPMDDSSEQH